MLANLAASLFEHKRITTTVTKAKLVELGLSLKDSPPGFDLAARAAAIEEDDAAFSDDEL
jgi:hypothetical protein